MQDGSLLQRHVGEYLNLTFTECIHLWKGYKHLPNQHQVSFYDHQTIPEILNDDYFSRTMLTEFFALNREEDQQSRHLLYRKIPEYYTWHNKEKEWRRRKTQRRSIGRIYTVSPSEGEKFYLRILLSNVRGPTSWDDLLTVN